MFFEVALWFVLVISLVSFIWLVIRKFSILKVIDPAKVAELRQQELKKNLVEARLRRKLVNITNVVWYKIKPLAKLLAIPFNSYSQRLAATEVKIKKSLTEHLSPAARFVELSEQAKLALEAGELTKAEDIYLAAIQLAPQQLEPYEGLARVYLEAKDYEQAREVFDYLSTRGDAGTATLGLARVLAGSGQLEEAVKSYHNAIVIEDALQPRLELAKILKDLGDYNAAFEQISAARRFEPNNPKVLDFFIELSIVNGQLTEAQGALDALRETNPDNKKITDFAREIRETAAKLKPKLTLKSIKISHKKTE